MHLNRNSLYLTVDNLNQTLFNKNEGEISSFEKKEISEWIAGRRGLKNSYWEMFAPTDKDYEGIKLYTGDSLTSKASIGHILSEESLRILYLLGIRNEKVDGAIAAAKAGLSNAIKRSYGLGYDSHGTYCCGKCTAAYWRNLAAEGTEKNKRILNSGLKFLTSKRNSKGKWKTFPFFYTLLALSEIDLPSAREEIKYAGDLCKVYITRKRKEGKYEDRKFQIAERVLEISSENRLS